MSYAAVAVVHRWKTIGGSWGASATRVESAITPCPLPLSTVAPINARVLNLLKLQYKSPVEFYTKIDHPWVNSLFGIKHTQYVGTYPHSIAKRYQNNFSKLGYLPHVTFKWFPKSPKIGNFLQTPVQNPCTILHKKWTSKATYLTVFVKFESKW